MGRYLRGRSGGFPAMTTWSWLMLWLDTNAVVGVGVCVLYGPEGLQELRRSLVDRLKRGVYGR